MDSRKSTALVAAVILMGILAGAGGYYLYQNRDLATPPVVSAATANSHYKQGRSDIAWSVPKPAAGKGDISQ